MLDLKLVRTFREVAIRGSFSAAADALGFTQPAVSQHVAKLERALGAQLLVRDARGVSVTPAGDVLLRHADTVLEQLRRAEREVQHAAGLEQELLRVGAFASAAGSLMPRALRVLRDADPLLRVDFHIVEHEPGLEDLTAGRLDVVVVTDSELVPLEPRPQVRLVTLAHDELLVALPFHHPLAARTEVDLRDLATEAWFTPILAGTCSDSNIVLRACADAGFEPDVRLASDDYQALLGMVASGMGVSLIPSLAGGALRPDLVVRPVAGTPPTRRVRAAVRDGEDDPRVVRVLAALREAGREIPAGGSMVRLSSAA